VCQYKVCIGENYADMNITIYSSTFRHRVAKHMLGIAGRGHNSVSRTNVCTDTIDTTMEGT